ncbi:MAG: exopolyphosphatase [Flavobacteriales bacterium]|nr:exopolyphosphatase [Flavobacteriales bacterium]
METTASNLDIIKIGVIDIGSNAVRLLVSSIIRFHPETLKRVSLVRVPVRLGSDAFTSGIISNEKITALTDSIKAFSLLMKVHNCSLTRAVATSAIRNSLNKGEILRHVSLYSGINIDVISGAQEAHLIAAYGVGRIVKSHMTYLFVEVGGGSTEISIYFGGKIQSSATFAMGAVRSLMGMTTDATVEKAKDWVKNATQGKKDIQVIASGGNINKVFKLIGGEASSGLDVKFLVQYFKALKKMSYRERVFSLSLNPDRADVIVPALEIYLSVIHWAGAKTVYAPAFSLSDGVTRLLADDIFNTF